MPKLKWNIKIRERIKFPFKVAINGSCTIFFVTPSGDRPTVLQSYGNSKVARGKRNIELTSAKIDLGIELTREIWQEKGQDAIGRE